MRTAIWLSSAGLAVALAAAVAVNGGRQARAIRTAASPSSGTYDDPLRVILTADDPSATVRYTIDGTEPGARSARYAQPIALNAPATIKARAFRWWIFPGELAAFTYKLRVAAPRLSPPGGSYAFETPRLEIASATTGAVVRCSIELVDSSFTPEWRDCPYVNRMAIGDSVVVVRAQAFKDGFEPSLVTTGRYVGTEREVEESSPGVVRLVGVDAHRVVPLATPLTFVLSGARFRDAWVSREDSSLPKESITVGPERVVVRRALADGRNKIDIEGVDEEGGLISGTHVLWAGARRLTVHVLDDADVPVGGALISVDFEDDVKATGVTDERGYGTLVNMPSGDWRITVEHELYLPRMVRVDGTTTPTVRMKPWPR